MKDNEQAENYKGFTLLESLLTLFLFSFICLLCLGYLRNAQLLTKHLQKNAEKEWHIFLLQLENEVQEAELLSVQRDSIEFYDRQEKQVIFIDYKGDKIIKSVNGGYQPLLTRVKSAAFQQSQGKIELCTEFENGAFKEASLIILKEFKE